MTSHFGHVFLSPDPYNAVTTRAQTHMVWQICSRQKGNFTTPVTFMNSHFDLVLFPYSVQSSCVQRFATPWTAAHQASLSIINSQSLLKFMSIEWVMPSNHLILCHPLLLQSSFPVDKISRLQGVMLKGAFLPRYPCKKLLYQNMAIFNRSIRALQC